MNFSTQAHLHEPTPIRTLHQHTQSVGATGGVYKGQGRNRRRLFQANRPFFDWPLQAFALAATSVTSLGPVLLLSSERD
jgi:hypothetical protein